MSEPVEGTFQLTGCSPTDYGASYATCSMTGVVTAPGLMPTAVHVTEMAPTNRWPQPGRVLPVVVDRADPHRLQVSWDRIPSGREATLQMAQQLADQAAQQMQQPGWPGAPAAPQGAPGPGVVGDPSRPQPGSPGGGLTPEQAEQAQTDGGRALGLRAADATVLAVHDVAVPPGAAGLLPPGGVADLTLDVALPGYDGWTARTRLTFRSPERRAFLAAVGRRLPVLVDPDRQDVLVVDRSRLGTLPG